MKFLRAYDSYLKRLGQDGAQKPGVAMIGLGPILLATMPFYAAIILVMATFGALGWTSFLGMMLKVSISLVLLAALFYSGFRVVHHRAQARKDQQGRS